MHHVNSIDINYIGFDICMQQSIPMTLSSFSITMSSCASVSFSLCRASCVFWPLAFPFVFWSVKNRCLVSLRLLKISPTISFFSINSFSRARSDLPFCNARISSSSSYISTDCTKDSQQIVQRQWLPSVTEKSDIVEDPFCLVATDLMS